MIEIKNLKKLVPEKTILNDINLEIKEGDFISIVGKSGSGKTTLLNIISLFDTYTDGDFFIFNKNVKKLSENKRSKIRMENIGFIFQDYNLISNLTVYQNLSLPFLYSNKEFFEENIDKTLKEFDLYDLKDRKVLYLSGGEKQRVSLARAIMLKPKLILADEPTGNLDQKNALLVMNKLKELNKQGTTIILVTHNFELLKFSKKIYYLRDGKLYEK